MSEGEKRGFFKRLFGRKPAEPEVAPTLVPPSETLPESPVVTQPAPVAEVPAAPVPEAPVGAVETPVTAPEPVPPPPGAAVEPVAEVPPAPVPDLEAPAAPVEPEVVPPAAPVAEVSAEAPMAPVVEPVIDEPPVVPEPEPEPAPAAAIEDAVASAPRVAEAVAVVEEIAVPEVSGPLPGPEPEQPVAEIVEPDVDEPLEAASEVAAAVAAEPAIEVVPPAAPIAVAAAATEPSLAEAPEPVSPEPMPATLSPSEVAVAAEPAIEEPPAAEGPVIEVVPVPEPPAPTVEPDLPTAPAKTSWWQKLKSGLARTSSAIGSGISAIFTKRRLDDAMLEDLEDILIQADLGLTTASAIVDTLRRERFDKEISDHEVRLVLAAEVEKVLAPVAKPLALSLEKKPHVVLVVGVNGSGKTTTIGKLAMKLARDGRSVTLAAGDTFRAAAIEQLGIWGKRTGAQVIAREPGADAASLAFDALVAARARGSDVLIIDTAGRLQNRVELMAELEKIIRVLKKLEPSAPQEVLLTLDATTGQNALNQVEIFGKVAGVTGLVMTKLDGTARGGILVAIAERFGLPVHFIGVGETAEDLEPFDAAEFARAIAGLERHH